MLCLSNDNLSSDQTWVSTLAYCFTFAGVLCTHCFAAIATARRKKDKKKKVLSASYSLVQFLIACLLCNGDMQRWITSQLFWLQSWKVIRVARHSLTPGALSPGQAVWGSAVPGETWGPSLSSHQQTFPCSVRGNRIPFSLASSLAHGKGGMQASSRSSRRELCVENGVLWSWPLPLPDFSQSHFFDLGKQPFPSQA